MSKFQCRCGHLMIMRTGDEEYKHRLLQDKVWSEKYFNFLDELPPVIAIKKDEEDELDKITSIIMDDSYELLRCPDCGRIYIDFDGDNKFQAFKPEA